MLRAAAGAAAAGCRSAASQPPSNRRPPTYYARAPDAMDPTGPSKLTMPLSSIHGTFTLYMPSEYGPISYASK